MLTRKDQLLARFAPGDRVQFKYRRKMVEGTLTRTNPKRAVVRVDTVDYTVPYELLFPISGNSAEREKRMAGILRMALNAMGEHGLKGWQFKFDYSTRRAGCCNYRDKLISISFDLARTGLDEDIRDTILHEIAHALVGKKHNHDAVWKAKAHEIGCTGERTHKLELAPPRWNVSCENRCWSHTAQRRNLRLVCRKCGGRLVYSPYSTTA